jgi:NAD(P)-dependent dehydrogenase (short-subunit alcohol dehydrogenase family)
MVPKPIVEDKDYVGSGKLKGKVAIISGGDSGIGKAVSIAFAKEGADVVIIYLCPYENGDALSAKKRIEELDRKCLLIQGDIGDKEFCRKIVQTTIEKFGKIDIVVNNAAIQFYQNSIQQVSQMQLERVFRTNVYSYFFLIQAALPYLKRGSTIINTASIVAYMGYKELIDYSATKGAVVTLTRTLALSLINRGIRVNGVAPGSVWTPLIASTFPPEEIAFLGAQNPIGRPAQPYELAPAYVFLASNKDSSFVTGQMIHVNGGMYVSS